MSTEMYKMEHNDHINTLIIRLFSGEATQIEKKQISEWIRQSEDNKKLFFDLRDIWLSSGSSNNADNYNLEGAINQFRSRINTNKQKLIHQLSIQNILKYAAVAILLLALPFSFYLGTKSNNSASSLTTISCAFGDHTNVLLPDSSVVYLNSGSKLTYSTEFRQQSRKVILEGEAFFSVTRDEKRPFRVKTKDMEIEVLGTKFNVKAYPNEDIVSTTLVEGSVHVFSQQQDAVIKPFEKIVLDKSSMKMDIQQLTDVAPDTEWKDGRFIFRNESLAELAPKLERWFDVDIEFADEKVKQRRFTGILVRESILEAVSYFDLSNLVKCEIQGNKIIIKSENK
jgi:ferric-dicitrate binding protein FerR (iron transport regulator)